MANDIEPLWPPHPDDRFDIIRWRERVTEQISDVAIGTIQIPNDGIGNDDTVPENTILSVDATFDSFLLTWGYPAADKALYNQVIVWRTATSGVDYEIVGSTNYPAVSFVDRSLAFSPNDTYYYVIQFRSASGIDGAVSNEASDTIPQDPSTLLAQLTDSLGFDQFDTANGVFPVRVVTALPTLPDSTNWPAGSMVYNTTDNTMYKTTDGLTWNAQIYTSDLDGQITETQIADDAITTPKIATNAVVADSIAANAIGTSELQADSVTAGIIAAGAVVAESVGTNEIITNSANIGTAVITGGNIANTTISSSNIVDGTITGTKIDSTTITASNIVGGTITGVEIDASTITLTNMANNAVDTDTIVADSVTVVEAAYTPGVSTALTTSFSTVQTLTVSDTDGGVGTLLFSVGAATEANTEGAYDTVQIQVLKGASVIYGPVEVPTKNIDNGSSPGSAEFHITTAVLASTLAGFNDTYYLQAKVSSNDGDDSWVGLRNLTFIGSKR